MKEYIEREAALDCFACDLGKKDYSVSYQGFMTESAFRINAIPAADVVPVVLCRECKYNMANIPDFQDGIRINENWNACQLTELYDSVKPDDFCSHGEKREES